MSEDKPVPSPTPNAAKPAGATPYRANNARFTGRTPDIPSLAPPQESGPEIQRGIDLTGRAKIIFAAGRGKTGKTTLLRWLTETSILNGGAPILADVDPSNATFSAYFANVARPDTDNPAGVAAWLQDLIEHCIGEQQSALIDLGGGDTTLRSLAAEMPGLAMHIEAAGMAPVLFHLTGTQPEDLAPALTLATRGFTPKAQALVFNEYAIEAGSTRTRAFSRLIASSAYGRLAQSSVKLWMPRLHAAEAVEARQCGFTAARDGAVDPPLGVFDAARVRVWLEAMDRRFAGVRSWIP
ncbi:MAG: P-loop NTPase family protein [Acidiphilium sp.]